MIDEMVETYDEYDESDFESDFEDLQFGEARRRPRNRRRRSRPGVRTSGSAWQRQPAPSQNGRSSATATQLKREAEAGRVRDKQLAREVTTTKEEISDVEGQLKKVNSDLASLRQLSLILNILPRQMDIQRQRVTITPGGDGAPPTLTTTTDQNAPGVNVVSGVSARMDILPIVLFMSMGKNIGKPGRGSTSGGMGDNSMMLVVLLLLMQQQQQQQSGNPGQTSPGGLDTTSLLLVLLASGGL